VVIYHCKQRLSIVPVSVAWGVLVSSPRAVRVNWPSHLASSPPHALLAAGWLATCAAAASELKRTCRRVYTSLWIRYK